MLAQVQSHGETFITLPGTAVLVGSASNPGDWHTTTTTSCTCKHFTFRRTPCRHIKALRQIANETIERYAPATGTEQAERAARIAEANRDLWG